MSEEEWFVVYQQLDNINENLDEGGYGCPDPPVPQDLQETARRYVDQLKASGQKFLWLMVGRDTRGHACVEYSTDIDNRTYVDIRKPGVGFVFRTDDKSPLGMLGLYRPTKIAI